MVPTSIKNDKEVNEKACIIHEVKSYIINTKNNKNLNPLKWRRVNGEKYMNVDRGLLHLKKRISFPFLLEKYLRRLILITRSDSF